MDEVEQDTSGFTPLYTVAQGTGILAVILTGVWMGHYRGGFAVSSEDDAVFNWHPLLMILGLVYMYGNGEFKVIKSDLSCFISFVPFTYVG